MNKYLPLVLVSIGLLTASTFVARGQVEQTRSKVSSVGTVVVKPIGYQPQKPTLASERGRRDYAAFHCAACHSINDVGGNTGPILDGVGGHRSAEFLLARLADSTAARKAYAKLIGQSVDKLAPHVRLNAKEAADVVSYLRTLPEPSFGFVISDHQSESTEQPMFDLDYRPQPTTAETEEGKVLYNEFGCAQCHQIQGAGGYFGPALDGEGHRRDANFIAAHISNAQVHAAQTDKFFEDVPTSMPRFNISQSEVKKITDFLLTLPDRE